MEVIVVGCGRVGAELAYRLYQKGHKVVVIDTNEAAFHHLHPDFRGRTVEGEVLNQEVLARAGIERADGVAVVTSSDTMNAVVAHIARSVYHISNVIVRNYDSRWRSLYEAFELQVISSASWGAQRIEELLYYQEIRSVFSAGNGEVELYEFTIPEAWQGKALSELLPQKGILPAAISRRGRAVLPEPAALLMEGDVLLVSATLEGVEELRRRMNQRQEV